MKRHATPAGGPEPSRNTPGRLTRQHAVLAGGLLFGACLLALLLPSSPVEAKRTVALELPAGILSPSTPDSTAGNAPDSAAVQADGPELDWQATTVRNGDSLFEIFKRSGLSLDDLPALLKTGSAAGRLKNIHPGDVLHYQADANGRLQQLRIDPSPLTTLVFQRHPADGFQADTITHTPEVRLAYHQATIDTSLFAAGQSQGLGQALLMDLADIFSGVVDFALDVRRGDSFGLIYEEQFLDGKRLGTGRILAAHFTNGGTVHRAYYFADGTGQAGYYNEDGVSMRKAFLRAPLDFTRVSSSFNPRRLHPVFKTVRPHNGIDYAAPRGTPVFAAGDGRVLEAGYSNANGHYVFIQHGTKYVTRYLHLHKRLVKTGQRVSQRQVIGQVGDTGYATGPHLHYEFLVNGTHRNPRTIINELPKAQSLDAQEKQRFLASTSGLRLQLATLQQTPAVMQLAGNALPGDTP